MEGPGLKPGASLSLRGVQAERHNQNCAPEGSSGFAAWPVGGGGWTVGSGTRESARARMEVAWLRAQWGPL